MSGRARLAGALLALATTAATAAPPATQALPEDWYPESVAIGPDGAFYVGSWRQGAVARLKPGAAPKAGVLVKPGANGLANGQGVLVDAKHQALWVCSGNSGFTTVPQTPSALKRYDLATGAPRASYAMPGCGLLQRPGAGRARQRLRDRLLPSARAAARAGCGRAHGLEGRPGARRRGPLQGTERHRHRWRARRLREPRGGVVASAAHRLGRGRPGGRSHAHRGAARDEERRRDPRLETGATGAVREQCLRRRAVRRPGHGGT
jgi:hypothetical protein